MKTIYKITGISALLTLVSYACTDDFLDAKPQGVYAPSDLLSKKGIDGMLINAYAGLDANAANFGIGPDNWIFGSVMGGEAYKAGVNFTDQAPMNDIMQYASTPTIPHVDAKWNAIFDGIGIANLVLAALQNVPEEELSSADRTRIEAEARFIRAFQHLEGKKLFNNIPFIDETVTDFKVSNVDASGNYVNAWPQIEADFEFGLENLPEVPSSKGRVNKWAAGAFLGKSYLYQHKYNEAKAVFDDVITSGKNSSGVAYALNGNYGTSFRVASQNSSESVFEIQMTVGDGSTAGGFYSMVLNYPNGIAGGTNSWFFRPSQNAVNTFRTDANGLPMPQTYNDVDVTSHETVPDNAPFTPYSGDLDPRLDHTVGRRGIPFLDWGMMNGVSFTAPPGESITNGGPYCQKKFVFSAAELGNGEAAKTAWGYYLNSINYPAMRYADLLLMAAECEVEVGSIDKAREYVNIVRARAAASVILNLDGSADAANYNVGQYPPFASKDDARIAVRFERRLELANEGHLFFDLVRWGIADHYVNNEYLPKEAVRRPLLFGGGVRFTLNRSEYQPIPIYAITQSNKDGQPTLKQNPGY